MTGSIRNFDQLRAHIWLCQTMGEFGTATPGALETLLRRHLNMNPENSGNLKRIADGEALPFHKKGRGPQLYRCAWPDRADQVLRSMRAAQSRDNVQPHLSGSALADPADRKSLGTRWLQTPFWFLIENPPSEGVLRECIGLLPERFQEELLEPAEAEQTGRAGLTFLARSCLYVFTDPLGPEALGALACARHRARISGDLGVERWCNVGLTWALMALERRAASQLKPALALLTGAFLLDAAMHVYASGVQLEIQGHEVEKFDRERAAYVAWTVEGQIVAGDTPAWVEA